MSRSSLPLGWLAASLACLGALGCGGGRSGVSIVEPEDGGGGAASVPVRDARRSSAVAVTVGGTGSPSEFDDAPVLFVHGQSNATALEFPAASVYNGPDLLTWEAGAWVPARSELAGHMPGGVGVLAGRLMRALLGESLAVGRIDNHGWPGKALAYFLPESSDVALVNGDYDPDGRNIYRVARDTWTASGIEPTLLLWSQGEADADVPATVYAHELRTLIDAWWRDYPRLTRIVIVQTAAGACGRNTAGVRAAQSAAVASDPRVRLVVVDDFTGDPAYHTGCHYTLAGYERIADWVALSLELAAL